MVLYNIGVFVLFGIFIFVIFIVCLGSKYWMKLFVFVLLKLIMINKILEKWIEKIGFINWFWYIKMFFCYKFFSVNIFYRYISLLNFKKFVSIECISKWIWWDMIKGCKYLLEGLEESGTV